MTAGVIIKALTRNDLDEVMVVERAAYPVPWSYGIFYDCMLAKYDCQGLWRGAELLGYFVLQTVLDEVHVLNLCVAPAHQRHGHGAYLLETAIAIARTQNSRRLLLEVRVSNFAAQALYQRHGLISIGKRKNYYPTLTGREDGIVMGMELRPFVCESTGENPAV